MSIIHYYQRLNQRNRILELTENELNKKREILDTIKNSEDYTNLKNKIEEHINDFLNQKKRIF